MQIWYSQYNIICHIFEGNGSDGFQTNFNEPFKPSGFDDSFDNQNTFGKSGFAVDFGKSDDPFGGKSNTDPFGDKTGLATASKEVS